MITKQKKLSKLILDRRKELKMSQVDLAKAIGLRNGQYIYNIESCQCGFPVKSLAKLSIVLQVPLERLKQTMVEDYYENITEEIQRLL